MEDIQVDALADEQEVDHLAVAAHGEITDQPGLLQTPQLAEDVIDHPVDARVLEQDAVDVAEQGMGRIGGVYLPVPLETAHQHPRLLEAVQLHADAIGRFPKLRLQAPQPGARGGVQEKLDQQFQSGLRCD